NLCCGSPAPGIEFGLMATCAQINLALVTGKPHCEPFLQLSTIFAFQGNTNRLWGQVVMDPFPRLTQNLYAAHAGFLVKLAESRSLRVFFMSDAALGHLPSLRRFLKDQLIEAPSNPNASLPVEKDNARARAVRQGARIFQ